ncbi:hypothetical protein, partial [Nocardia gipuzkoensis]
MAAPIWAAIGRPAGLHAVSRQDVRPVRHASSSVASSGRLATYGGRTSVPQVTALRDHHSPTTGFERSETEHAPFAARLASEWPP